MLRLDAPLYYANASANRDAMKRLVESAETLVHTVIFSPEVQHHLDLTAVEMLTELITWMRWRGIAVYFSNVHRDALAEAQHARLVELVGPDHIVADIPGALARAGVL